MTNEVMTPTGSAVIGALSGSWGAANDIDSGDILMPKIYHQQAISDLTKEGKARAGDFCDSITGEVIAKKDDGLSLIIITLMRRMVRGKFDPVSAKFERIESVLITPANAIEMSSRSFNEEDSNGERYRNSIEYDYCCLLPDKIKEFPYIFTFHGTKSGTAKKLNFFLKKLELMNQPSAAYVFNFKNKEEKMGKNSWFGLEVSQGRPTTPEELIAAHNWYTKSKSQKFVASEEAHEDDGL